MNISTIHQKELKELENSITGSHPRTKEQELQLKQIRWINMIDSCFTYGELYNLPKYLNDKIYDLPVKMKQKIMDEHIAFLQKNATVQHNVYEDCEGCTYNSLDY